MGTDFSVRVLELAGRIPRGRVTTYAEIARGLGSPGSCRAVGQALKANPEPVRIPCHRVVRSDGRVGGYGGHGRRNEGRKARLLLEEGVPVENGRVDLGRCMHRF
jgi:methylated-DNA-[protein]-cysteine S-methyltransferase